MRRGSLRRVHRAARRRAGLLVYHARPHGRRARGDDDRGPARSPARRRIRAHRCAPVRLLHAGPDRLGLGARREQPGPERGRDPARDGREPLPLRHVSENRGGDRFVARLIRTEKEVEGRYEDIWLVVEEDALEQWSAGPREIVGQPAPRKTGPLRARGEARYTADIRLPGMLHAAVLRSPHASARVKKISVDGAFAAPGVRAVVGPGDAHVLTDEPGFQGQAVAAVAADTIDQARAAVALIEVEWDVRKPLLDPDEAARGGQLVGGPSHYERGDVEGALAQADVVVEAEYRTQTVLH